MPREFRVRPGPGGSLVGGIAALLFAALGILVIIPTLGVFGIMWTLLALFAAAFGFYNAFSKRPPTDFFEVSDTRPEDNSGK